MTPALSNAISAIVCSGLSLGRLPTAAVASRPITFQGRRAPYASPGKAGDAAAAVVPLLTFMIVLTGLCATATTAGSKLQPMIAGKPTQVRLTVLLNPPTGVILTVTGEV